MLDDEQWAELWDGLRQASRQNSGTVEAYKSLSPNQKEVVDKIQDAAFLKGSSSGYESFERARSALNALSGEAQEELGDAIPSEAEAIFQSMEPGTDQSPDQSEGEDQSEDQGRDRGYDRGMSI